MFVFYRRSDGETIQAPEARVIKNIPPLFRPDNTNAGVINIPVICHPYKDLSQIILTSEAYIGPQLLHLFVPDQYAVFEAGDVVYPINKKLPITLCDQTQIPINIVTQLTNYGLKVALINGSDCSIFCNFDVASIMSSGISILSSGKTIP